MLRWTINRYRSAYADLPLRVWLLSLAHFVNRCGSMVLTFLTLYLTREIGLTEQSACALLSVYGVGSIFGSYMGGWLADRYGAGRTQTACLFLSVPAFLLIPAANGIVTIGAALFLLSLISDAVRPANNAAIAEATNSSNRTRAFALQRMAGNLGFSFGPVIGGLLATISFHLIFVVDAVTTMLAAIILWNHFRRDNYSSSQTESAQRTVGGQSPLRDGVFVAFLLLMLLTSVIFHQFSATYPLYLTDHYELSKPMIGLMFAVNTTIIVVFEMLLVDAVKNRSMLKTVGWGALLTCLGFWLLPFGTSILYCMSAMAVLTVGEMLCIPMAAGFVANRSPRGREAKYMGWFTIVFAVAGVCGPLLGAWLYNLNPTLLWQVAGAIGVVTIIGFYALERRYRQAESLPVMASKAEPVRQNSDQEAAVCR